MPMRRSKAFVRLVMGLIACQTGSVAVPAAEPPAAVRVPKAAEPPVVDGRLEDACWQRAPVTAVDMVMGKTGQQIGRAHV